MAAKTKISEISEGGVALGENKYKESQLLDVAIKAGELVKMTATGIALANMASGTYLGVMKEHEEFDLDTDIDAGEYGDVVTEGYVAAFITGITDTWYPGTYFYTCFATPGSLTLSPAGPPVAVLERTINTGDTVAIVKLLR